MEIAGEKVHTALEEILARLERILTTVHAARGITSDTSDKVFGATPTALEAKEGKSERPGMMGRITDKLDDLENATSNLLDEIQHFTSRI